MSDRDKGVALYKSAMPLAHVKDCYGLYAVCESYKISVLRLFCVEPLERIEDDSMFGAITFGNKVKW